MPFRILARGVQVQLSVERIRQDVVIVDILQFESFLLLDNSGSEELIFFLFISFDLGVDERLEAFRFHYLHVDALDADDFFFDPAIFGSVTQHVPVRV